MCVYFVSVRERGRDGEKMIVRFEVVSQNAQTD